MLMLQRGRISFYSRPQAGSEAAPSAPSARRTRAARLDLPRRCARCSRDDGAVADRAMTQLIGDERPLQGPPDAVPLRLQGHTARYVVRDRHAGVGARGRRRDGCTHPRDDVVSIGYMGDDARRAPLTSTAVSTFAAVYKSPCVLFCRQWAISVPIGKQSASEDACAEGQGLRHPYVHVGRRRRAREVYS